MKFSVVSEFFGLIEQASKRLEITRLLADLFTKTDEIEIEIITHLSIGQLNPPHIGTQFNIAEKNMAPIVAKLIGQEESKVSAQAKRLGDLGTVLEREDWGGSGTISVVDLFKKLIEIEKISGTGSQERKAEHLLKLLQRLDSLSAKYVVRIILGKLRLGFSDMTIVDALSWMEVGDKSLRSTIENAYNVCADIGLIAKKLKKSGIRALEKIEIEVGVPIRPAAAERLPTARAVIEKIGACVAQPKLDGFRLQIHVDKRHKKPKIHFYSRNLQDMSSMFPDLVAVLEQAEVKTMICEGEAICFNPHTGDFLPFQETVKRKRKHGIEQAITEFPLKVLIFDLLYLDGEEYITKTHEQRRKKLESLEKKFKHELLSVIDEVPISSARELEEYFISTIAAGLEGLVIKRPDSVYTPGKRNFSWIKLKRQEEGKLEDTVDCVILGYYRGSGKRAAFGIGAFLVGIYNKKEDLFQTVAKVGTGLKDKEWKELRAVCDEIAVERRPSNVSCAKELAPDVWVSPEVVCLVRADEITISPVHTAGKTESKLGYALRFPRFMGYRDDKGPFEATTNTEIKRLYDDQFEK